MAGYIEIQVQSKVNADKRTVIDLWNDAFETRESIEVESVKQGLNLTGRWLSSTGRIDLDINDLSEGGRKSMSIYSDISCEVMIQPGYEDGYINVDLNTEYEPGGVAFSIEAQKNTPNASFELSVLNRKYASRFPSEAVRVLSVHIAPDQLAIDSIDYFPTDSSDKTLAVLSANMPCYMLHGESAEQPQIYFYEENITLSADTACVVKDVSGGEVTGIISVNVPCNFMGPAVDYFSATTVDGSDGKEFEYELKQSAPNGGKIDAVFQIRGTEISASYDILVKNTTYSVPGIMPGARVKVIPAEAGSDYIGTIVLSLDPNDDVEYGTGDAETFKISATQEFTVDIAHGPMHIQTREAE